MHEKYANMSLKELEKSLNAAKKKKEKIAINYKKQNEELKNLIAFLKGKVKASLEESKYEFVPIEQTRSAKIAAKIRKTMSKAELEALRAEVLADINTKDEDDD